MMHRKNGCYYLVYKISLLLIQYNSPVLLGLYEKFKGEEMISISYIQLYY
jgi:hypothetical protein